MFNEDPNRRIIINGRKYKFIPKEGLIAKAEDGEEQREDFNNSSNPDNSDNPNNFDKKALISEDGKKQRKEVVSNNSSSNSSRRVVMFNNEKTGKEVVKYIPYDQFLKSKAEKTGMKVKNGRFINKDGEIDDGNLCEEAILGRCYDYIKGKQVPIPLYGLNKIEKKKAEKIILDFIRKHQPPRELMPSIAKNVLQRIKDKTRLLAQDDFNGIIIQIKRVDLFTAVGTPLDFIFGIDGWIEIETDDGHTEIITFDLKTGNYKKFPKDLQADLVMGIEIDYTEIVKQKKREFKISEKTVEELERFVEKVMNIYKGRLQRLGV